MKQSTTFALCVFLMTTSSTSIASQESFALAQKKIGAYKVMTEQFAIASKATINNLQRLAEGELASISMLDSFKEQMVIYKEYSAYTGQGAQVCDAANNSGDISRIAEVRGRYVVANVQTAGRPNINPSNYMQARVKEQLSDYCSADQHNMGICRAKLDGMAGASTNFATLMQKEQFTTKDYKAANTFVANLVTPPNAPINTKRCNTPACMELAAANRTVDSFSSLVAHSYGSVFSNRIGTKTYAEIKTEN